MEFKIVLLSARRVTYEIITEDIYTTKEYDIYLNGQVVKTSKKIIDSIDGLVPDTTYKLWLKAEGEQIKAIPFKTKEEFITLDVKQFGAKGDGFQDDTIYIQAAISACPVKGRVYIPKGIYKTASLFLKSNIMIELAKDAVISAVTAKEEYPVLPGLIESTNEREEYNLGTWEGNPLDMYAGIINGLQVSNVLICGNGTIDGNASYDNWWKGSGIKGDGFRPRVLFLNRCKNITVEGITFKNSPSWCIHPYFSSNLRFLNLAILNPKDAPNTDGLNPESCKKVEILGVYFSVGDDCIAIKSGKIYMGKKYKVPSSGIRIRQCYMKEGHGSVTVGSETGAGVNDVSVSNCYFSHTDRGLRIKTRRGRGEDAVIDSIEFNHIYMDNVLIPFAVTAFYFCDPDGHSDYVRSKEPLPVDDRTPAIKNLIFRNIECHNCHIGAGFFYGLPERKIEKILMENIQVDFSESPKKGVAEAMDDLEATSREGIYVNNVSEFIGKNIIIKGHKGKGIITENIDTFTVDDHTGEQP